MGHWFLPIFLASWLSQGVANDAFLIVPDAAVLKLDDMGLYRIGLEYRGQPERDFPAGWSGPFDEQTGVACQPVGAQNGRQALLMHCPWRNGTGITFQEFHIQLPRDCRAILRGATALRAEGVGKSDGVTFRISAGSRKLLDVHRSDAAWQDFEYDLSGAAGTVLILRFETDPGPKDNPSFDFGLWGDRTLALEGLEATPRHQPSPPSLTLGSLVSRPAQGSVPPPAFRSSSTWKRDGNTVSFRYEGDDGTMEYRWEQSAAGQAQNTSMGLFGKIALTAFRKGANEIRVPLGSSAQVVWAKSATALGNRWDPTSEAPVLIRTFKVGDVTTNVRIKGSLIGKSLVLETEADRPLAELLDSGTWGPMMRRRVIPVPYFSGQVAYLPVEGLFVSAGFDWTSSGATSLDGLRALYSPLTDGSRNSLRERVVFTAAWNLDEVLPNIPNPPSPFLQALSDRVVLDIWGGRYTDIARNLEVLSSYGVNHCVAIIHDWQRSGYDNALPTHLPAAVDKGGDDAMKTLVATGTRLGYLVALHENYVDYYPNYDHFREADIALDSTGKPQNAWYNPGTKIQSFAVKPNAILPLAATQSAEIHRRYGTNGCYLDVHSAVPPWFHVDQRSGEEGAGAFHRVWEVHRSLWDYERKTHTGPVFGEGNNHWYWSGYLDGVEAQFGSGWPSEAGREVPLLVDFDLLKIHSLQLNHGMGYYERWWGKPTWSGIPPMVILDQYRMQEVAFGHAGFLGASTWSVIPLAWLEHHLLTPVMARFATAKPLAIHYDLGGKWADATVAAQSEGNPKVWQRVRVRYDNGLTITANQAEEPLRAGGHLLGQYGWVAEGAGVTAWTAKRDNVVADYAETADSVFANARSARDWNLLGTKRIRPEIGHFQVVGPRQFRVSYAWRVNEALPRDYSCFVHFGKKDSPESEILFQQDNTLTLPTSRWRPGRTFEDGPHEIRVPDNLPDGDYAWTIGLFTPVDGRLSLEGVEDGSGRTRLGTLRVSDGGHRLDLSPESKTGDQRTALYLEHVNLQSKIIDFGPVRTDGSVVIEREGSQWVARTFPRDRAFTLLLDSSRFGRPAEIHCIGGRARLTTVIQEGTFWKLPLNGASQYQWTAR